jgi:carboxypeptidase PM20D1
MIRSLLLGLGLALVVLAGVLVARTLTLRADVPEFRTARLAPIDGDAAVERFAGAIRFPTISHEDASLTDSSAFRALHDYFEVQYPAVHAALGREVVGGLSLLYTWEGTEPALEPVVLMAHMDVVPVIAGTESGWAHPPYAGVVADGFVWGRGTMDDKSAVSAILESVETLVADGFRPRRTVYLAFGHDEEVGGARGAAAIAELLEERGAEPYALVLDEGGLLADGLIPGIAGPVALIGSAEKGFVSLELVVEGDGGHSSMPPAETNIGILSAAITRLQDNPFPARLGGATEDMFVRLAPHMSFGGRLAFANLWLLRPIVTRMLASEPTSAAMVRTTTAPTIIEGGEKDNVLPIRARAVVNHRILPGETPESVLARDEDVIDDSRVQVSFLAAGRAAPSSVSDPEGAAFAVLERTIHEASPDQGIVVVPWLVVAGTDAKHYGGRSRNVFRYIHVRVDDDASTRIHGTDERISVENFLSAVDFFRRLIPNTDDLP